MIKNNTDSLLTKDFGQMCMANLLLYTSVYLLLPLLPRCVTTVMGEWENSWLLLAMFGLGMVAVGPFHAYLGDAYKRKNVFIYATLLWLLATAGYLFLQRVELFLLLVLMQGVGFGLAVTAGITVAIDITTSERRTDGNVCYAISARTGMMLGILASYLLTEMFAWKELIYTALACGTLSLLLVANVYVSFRAPMGVGVCNLDRFLLPRAWLPAVTMLVKMSAVGLLIPIAGGVGGYVMLLLTLLVLQSAFTSTKMFVNLSQHCQRGTANTTCYLSMDAGLLLGMGLCYYVGVHLCSIYTVLLLAGGIFFVSLLLYLLATRPYYKKYRVR